MPRTNTMSIMFTTLLATLLLATGCNDLMIEKADPTEQRKSLERRNFEIEVQPIMRGTIAAEAAFVGNEPTIVRGYGLVVGLKGTGSRLMPAPIRASMLQEMARKGIGDAASGWGGLSPERMLDSEDTAIVVVEGVIPAGGVQAEKFDVRVFVLPGSGTTSLEGGILYTTELRPGQLQIGSKQATALASARGRIFINPFVEPDASGQDSIDRLTGRILDGGTIGDNMPLKLRLAVRSHPRAMAVRDAVNSRFPKEQNQESDTAEGKSGDEISITVPPSFASDPETFVELVTHTSLRPEATEQIAASVRRSLLANPGFSRAATWRFKALGPKAIPMFQDLYDYPEEGPRLAALTAGAYLNDGMVTSHLLDLAGNGSTEARIVAIEMLGDMQHNPNVDMGLRPLLDDQNVDIRLATFEALEQRRDPIVAAYDVDKKFILNMVPSDHQMIYVSQVGTPRIVLFGDEMKVSQPMIMTAWSNRLLVKGDDPGKDLEVYYREAIGVPAQIEKVSPNIGSLVTFFGHQTTIEAPAPGIGLTYGETIGAIYKLWRSGFLDVDFKAEQDRVLAAILRAQKVEDTEDRPEFESDLPLDLQERNKKSTNNPFGGGVDPNGSGDDTVPR